MRRGILAWLVVLASSGAALAADVQIVRDGAAAAVVVVADDPTPVAKYAAQEFVYHVEKATGARLAVVLEGDAPATPKTRIFIGNTKATRAAGIDAGRLPPETLKLRSRDHAFFIAGGDADGSPLHTDTPAGTLFGVYETLEEALGVRWLWPGELGEFVPKTKDVLLREQDRSVAPRFIQRHLRSGLGARGAKGFSDEAFRKAVHDQAVWLRRHRMGRSMKLRYGHAFTDWGVRYGQEHPEWFNLLENGKRDFSSHGRFSMCVSNAGFHEQIVRLWKEQRAQNPGEFININCCENDVNGLCVCENCRAWDGPDRPAITPRYAMRCVSDRYARFWLAVQQLAAREDPQALVMAYAYVNYAPPPATDIRLNQNILVGAVPDIFFPRSPEERQWVFDQWVGWAKTGCRLFLRPNYTLQGYCMPHLFMRQFAEEFQFDAKHAMVATDFDSLTAMWSAQGPNLYLLGRLHVRPEEDVEKLLAEYYSGFGPAAASVKAYFDYWEKYMLDNRVQHEAVAQKLGGQWSNYAVMAHEIYPPASFEPAYGFLDAAAKAAADDPACAGRVEFLRKGLLHAQLCAKVAAVVAGREQRPSPAVCGRAVAELQAFRKTIEMDNVANLNFCAFVEQRGWRIPQGYGGEPLKAVVAAPAELKGAPVMPVRHLHTFVALLGEGERFRANVVCRQIGKYTTACDWTVFGPDDQSLAQGAVEPGKEALVETGRGRPGVYCLVVNAGANVAAVTMLNRHAALTGHNLHLLGESAPLFFLVPDGAQKFSLSLQTDSPGETASLKILDPEGRQVAAAVTGTQKSVALEAAVAPGLAGKAWRVVIEPGGGGVLEDVRIGLDPALPPYWAHAADRLVAPDP